jgi:hypothetical protein
VVEGAAAPLLWGGWVAPQTPQRKRRGSLTNPRRPPSSLARLHHVGREMLDKLVGIALQDVVDGKGKRLGRNVRPVLAAELQVIAEGGEVHADLGLLININVPNVS